LKGKIGEVNDQKCENTSGVTIFECKHVRECVRFYHKHFFFLFCTALKMSHKSYSTPEEEANNSFFVLRAMQQQFERLNLVLEEVKDRMDQQEVAIRNMQGGRDRRRGAPSVENEFENEGDDEEEEDIASEVRMGGVDRPRGCRCGRGHERNPRGRDGVAWEYQNEIPSFQGRTDTEALFRVGEENRVNFLLSQLFKGEESEVGIIEFTDYAIIWWDQLVTNRRRNHDKPMETWGELKALMRRKFVSSHYYRDHYQKLQNLTQVSRSVEDYHKEMGVAMIRANVEDDREATMARYLSGLNRDIANVVELQHYVEVEDMAMKVERQLKRKGAARYTSVSITPWKSKRDRNDQDVVKGKAEPPKGKDEGTSKNKLKVDFQPSRNRDIKCFKCLGLGHIASQCLNKRVMVMRDNGEVMTDSEDDSDEMPELVDASDDDGVEYPVEGESHVARRVLNMQIKIDSMEQQRENIFHTRCYVNNMVCSMIIDEGSCTNIASTTLVEKLSLPLLKHPRPYKLQWLNECEEVKVNKQVFVAFTIGRYSDEVLCDVVSMHAGRILLGRPWQYDRRVIHDGFKNKYNFVKDGKTIKLAPLTPKQVYEDQLKLKSEIDQKRKSEKENKEVPKNKEKRLEPREKKEREPVERKGKTKMSFLCKGE